MIKGCSLTKSDLKKDLKSCSFLDLPLDGGLCRYGGQPVCLSIEGIEFLQGMVGRSAAVVLIQVIKLWFKT